MPIIMEETTSEMETKATSMLEIMLMILVTEVIRVPTTSVYWITLSSAPCSRMAAL